MIAPFRHLSEPEQHRLALPVLVAARVAVVAGGEPIDSIQQAGMAGIACVYARNILTRIVGTDISRWQQFVIQSDMTRAFDRAIRLAKSAFGRRGGWSISRVKADLAVKNDPTSYVSSLDF